MAGTTLWLIAGTKFLLGLHDVVNFATHRPNQDVSIMFLPYLALINRTPAKLQVTNHFMQYL